MLATGESKFISARSGEKNGKLWFMIKFLDDSADEFFTAFVDQSLYEQFQGIAKHTPVVLTMNIVPGQRFFTLESVEIIEN